jgi:hypothetical protein
MRFLTQMSKPSKFGLAVLALVVLIGVFQITLG